MAWAAGQHAGRQVSAFLAAHGRCRQVQDDLLRRLLASAAGSRFARDHGLAAVGGYDDLRRAVPVGDYETLRPYMDAVAAGDFGALLAPGTRVLMLATTSGSTGKPKHIPVTRRFLDEYRRGWNVWGLRALNDHRGAWLRGLVTLTSSAREGVSAGGLPCGAISGLLAQTQKWTVRRMYPVPPAVADVADATAKYYLVLRCAITRDVGMLTAANPSSAIKLAEVGRDHAEALIRDIRDGAVRPPTTANGPLPALRFRPDPAAARRLEQLRSAAGQLLPRDYWRLSVMGLWTGGTVGLYLPRVRDYFGDVPIRDIGLLASEGRLSVPLEDNSPSGVADIVANFLEFIPVDQADSPRPDVLRADQVDVGREYLIVMTNWAGLWRYNLNDRVRVVARLGQTPVIEFLSRGLYVSSITGEKLTEHQVVAAMADSAGAVGRRVELFILQPHFADVPYYELRVEADAAAAAALASAMDGALRRQNIEYDAKRSGGRLGPVRPTPLPPGELAARQAQTLARTRSRLEQYKHRFLMTEVVRDS